MIGLVGRTLDIQAEWAGRLNLVWCTIPINSQVIQGSAEELQGVAPKSVDIIVSEWMGCV